MSRIPHFSLVLVLILLGLSLVSAQDAFCDSTADSNCIVDQRHDLSPDSYGFSSLFISQNTAVMKSLSGQSNISIFNTSFISGLWRGSFNISTNETKVKPGAEFKPEGGNIVIGSSLPNEFPNNYPRTCEEVSGSSGIYKINPDGKGGTPAFEVYCEMDKNGGGWTLIISQYDLINLPNYYDNIPEPGVNGVRDFYLKHDLKQYSDKIWVSNHQGQEKIFDTSQFTGPLVTDSNNFVDAYDQSWNGLMAGNNSPVLTHYQVGQSCDSASCRNNIDSSTSYCNEIAQIWDWQNGDGSTDKNYHAHFGCKSKIEDSWSYRGELLYIR